MLLVEVADLSLAIDLVPKAPEYAAAGITPYLVAGVRGERVFALSDPDPAGRTYCSVVEYGRGDRLPVGDATLAVADLFD